MIFILEVCDSPYGFTLEQYDSYSPNDRTILFTSTSRMAVDQYRVGYANRITGEYFVRQDLKNATTFTTIKNVYEIKGTC